MDFVNRDDIIKIIKDSNIDIDIDNVKLNMSLTEQGADSLDMINILFGIEEMHDIKIPEESIEQGDWMSIDNMVANLNKLLQM
jgi:acyl carrier protein